MRASAAEGCFCQSVTEYVIWPTTPVQSHRQHKYPVISNTSGHLHLLTQSAFLQPAAVTVGVRVS